MQIKIYQVDAFADKVFSGNPAAVCPLNKWPDNSIMQKIAMENNLAETAFYVKENDGFRIRWFTPATEVDLCGHATLATAFVIFNYENYSGSEINFASRSGILNVRKQDNLLTFNFPTDVYNSVELSPELTGGFNAKPVEAYKGKTDFMLVFENEAQIKSMKPDFHIIEKLPCRGIIITAKGDSSDFVSRFFAPQSGINEDPVTGSAHTTLTPYWAQKLGKNELTAIQLSPRVGYLKCKFLGERVEISGNAVLYLIGNIEISS